MDKNFLIGGLAVAILALLGFLYLDSQNEGGDQSVAQNGANTAQQPAPQAGQSAGATQAAAPVAAGPSQQLSEVTVPDQPFSQSQPNAAGSAQPGTPSATPSSPPAPAAPKEDVSAIPTGNFSSCKLEWGPDVSSAPCRVESYTSGGREIIFTSRIIDLGKNTAGNVIDFTSPGDIRMGGDGKGGTLDNMYRLAKFFYYVEESGCIIGDGTRTFALCLER